MGQGNRGTEGKGAGLESWPGQGGAGTRGVRRHRALASGPVTPLGCAALICFIKGHSGLHTATSSGQFSSLLLTSNTADPS